MMKMMTVSMKYSLILSSLNAVFSMTVGDKICYDGFIMDRFCIDRTTLLDNPTTRTLSNPERHSVHCLVDVGSCRNSGFEMLSLERLSNGLHGRAYRIASEDDDKIIQFARSNSQPGYCSTCNGPSDGVTNGFKAVIHGTVKSVATSSVPAVISIDDIFETGTTCNSNGSTNSTGTGNSTGNMIEPVFIFESDSNLNSLILTHARMMIIGWGTLLPLGVIIANLGRHRPNGLWFKIHRPLQIIGLTFALVGWIIALTQFTALEHGSGTSLLHARLGMIVMTAGLAQPLNAFIRPHIEEGEKKTTKRLVWEIVHKLLGYGSVFLAVAVILIGTNILPIPDDKKTIRFAYGIGSGSVLLLTILYLMYDKYQYQNKHTTKNNEEGMV